jgi:hypothetical protein
MWFDMLEHEHLKAMKDSESIDIGDPGTGKEYDRMIRMVDAKQPHIHYEACTSCYGIFLDAGEFRDYKEERVIDFFRDLFAKERK